NREPAAARAHAAHARIEAVAVRRHLARRAVSRDENVRLVAMGPRNRLVREKIFRLVRDDGDAELASRTAGSEPERFRAQRLLVQPPRERVLAGRVAGVQELLSKLELVE